MPYLLKIFMVSAEITSPLAAMGIAGGQGQRGHGKGIRQDQQAEKGVAHGPADGKETQQILHRPGTDARGPAAHMIRPDGEDQGLELSGHVPEIDGLGWEPRAGNHLQHDRRNGQK